MKATYSVRIPESKRWNRETQTYDATTPEYWAHIELTVNLEGIAQHLGRKAARSKARRSTAMASLIKAKAL